MEAKIRTLVRPTGVVVYSSTPFFYFQNLFLFSYFCYSLFIEIRRRAISESEDAAEFLLPTPSFRRTRADLGKFQNCVSNFSGNGFEPYGKDTPKSDFLQQRQFFPFLNFFQDARKIENCKGNFCEVAAGAIAEAGGGAESARFSFASPRAPRVAHLFWK